MCNTKQYIEETTTYFTNMIGESLTFKPVSKSLQEIIPVAVSSNFTFYEGHIWGQQVVLAYISNGDSIPPVQMKKLLDIVARLTEHLVILVTPNVSSYNKVRLMAQKVNFVIPNKNMFLPSLLLEIKPDRTIGADLKETIPPFAQFLILYHLQATPITGASSYELSERFSVSYATVNKALRWLASKELVRLDGTKTKTIKLGLKGRELWNKALPLLVSPIEQVFYTDTILENQIVSGINALSSYTMINEEPFQCYAMVKKDLKQIGIEYDRQFGQNKIEVWRYNPRLFSTTGVVDRLSLYLSLMDEKDERIQIELERLIDEMQW